MILNNRRLPLKTSKNESMVILIRQLAERALLVNGRRLLRHPVLDGFSRNDIFRI